MSINPIEKYFAEYIEEELPGREVIHFHDQLAQDPACYDHLDRFYQIHILLKQYQRPQPDKILLQEYYANLQKEFCSPTKRQRAAVNRLSLIFRNLIYTKSLLVRTAETFVFVLIGILLGWIFFYGADDTQVGIDLENEYISSPITNDDLNYIYYYFQASEIILLEMNNMNELQTKEDYDINFNKEIAQKLLKMTLLVHERALQLNDIRILRFLGKMEIIMYQLSNMQEDEVDESLEEVRIVIQEADLLEEAKRLQVVMEKTRSSAG